ncbi:MAG: prepilin-type N-terminal cleavage/methylation domain-containing protein [Candidatus Omnitrophica bacterium]|nr:prepilin-type N-terminal cleavage/methylation domain-containing protein [Candidatus Omnitrophota bacterium]MCA9448567.1 prepilin-type N-terminal cleavage/methylation domain-containing protein [Candidatus Omnitrophota bacterium]MCB9768174.1 prepilin-type N-terminal cleavage/methylation domain-containing protein [Candidatus Omnitrophota bacterium]
MADRFLNGSKYIFGLFRTPTLNQVRGFTLIELLIVIAIILILIAIALPNFLEAQVRAKIAKAKGEMRTLGIAMDSYFLDWKMYPPDNDPNDFGQNGFNQLTSPIAYITSIPQEPFAQRSGLDDPGGEFGYEMGSSGLVPIVAAAGVAVRNNVHAFNIQSYAPDVDDDWNGNDDWPYCGGGPTPCQGGCNMMTYSPTNGTKSNGDLYHTGGEFNYGSYCVDGWRTVFAKFP